MISDRRVFSSRKSRIIRNSGSAVTIAVDATGEHACLRVLDDGPGVPDAERERIFGRFERGGRAGGGFGLGLAIARGLARQMEARRAAGYSIDTSIRRRVYSAASRLS